MLASKINLKIWHLAWPMILANISIPLLGFVDTAVIGHLPSSHFLAGTALASFFISVLFWLMGFLRMSTTGLVAKARGKKDPSLAIQHLLQAIGLSFVIACLLILFQGPLFSILMAVSSDELSMKATYDAAATYFEIRIWAAPLVLANMSLTGFLIGSGNTKWVMKALIVCNLTNLFADLLFVPVLGWGVAGVAYASVLAELVQLLVYVFFIKPELKLVGVRVSSLLQGWSRLLQMNGNLFIRSALLQTCLLFMTVYATKFGSQTVAINSILMQFFLFLSFALDGIAYALESLVGKADGANRQQRLRAYIVRGVQMSSLFAIGYAFIYWLFADSIISLLTDIPTLRSALTDYYLWIYILPLSCFMSFLYDGIFVGLGWDKAMRNSMAIAALVFFAVVGFFEHLDNHGLWLAFIGFMLSRGLSQAVILKVKLNNH